MSRSLARMLALAGIAVVTGCGGGTPAGSPAATAASPAAVPTVAPSSGPATYADWQALQGFGGGSGVAGLGRAPRYLREHRSHPGFDLDASADLATALVGWLGAHQATHCWAKFHDAMRAQLVIVEADFAKLQQVADAGATLADADIDRLEAHIALALAIPTPSACP